jgi:hypothetical protein
VESQMKLINRSIQAHLNNQKPPPAPATKQSGPDVSKLTQITTFEYFGEEEEKSIEKKDNSADIVQLKQ